MNCYCESDRSMVYGANVHDPRWCDCDCHSGGAMIPPINEHDPLSSSEPPIEQTYAPVTCGWRCPTCRYECLAWASAPKHVHVPHVSCIEW